MTFIIWGALLLLQNFTHTLSSRAKNSHSLIYNAIASTASNSVWFASQFFIVQTLSDFQVKSWGYILAVFVFYTVFTVIGSLSSHYLAMRVFEKRLEQSK